MDKDSYAQQKPIIAKYVAHQQTGVQPYNIRRHVVGYISRGKKYIYNGDSRREVNAGDVFYLDIGNHYMEDIPENGKSFEQIIFYYDPQLLNKTISNLSLNYNMNVTNDHSCGKCRESSYFVPKDSPTLKSFFKAINQYFNENLLCDDPILEKIKLTELIYIILQSKDQCLKSRILNNMDATRDGFEQIVHKNIFKDLSIDELAKMSNRSLTSFKKDFKRHFKDSPHQWFIRQRLMYARLQLISTSKSIAEIGNECNFPNTSHFIKLFKKEFDKTPAIYRKLYNNQESETLRTIPVKILTTA